MPRPLIALAALLLCTAPALAADVHWEYEGAAGPAAWGGLTPQFAACAAGQQQSPIDIAATVPAALPPLRPDWPAGAGWSVVDNGHTVQASATGEAGNVTVEGTAYKLVQFHFHHPSEHTIGGVSYPMEVHFVHQSAEGKLAVVGVMLGGGGAPGPLDAILAAADGDGTLAAPIDPTALLPANPHYWRYHGSLTTPPCSEIVAWTLMAEPVEVSDAAIAAFAHRYEMDARPVQPLHRRFVLAH